jgi:hypothetical protein
MAMLMNGLGVIAVVLHISIYYAYDHNQIQLLTPSNAGDVLIVKQIKPCKQ